MMVFRRVIDVKRLSPGVVRYSFYRSKTAVLPVTTFVVHHPDYEITEMEMLSEYFCEMEHQRDLFIECILCLAEQQERFKMGYYTQSTYLRRVEFICEFVRQHMVDVEFDYKYLIK